MTTDLIWLEVDKTNGAICSYYTHLPSTSAKFDYVEVTQNELTFLNALEDAVLPPGMVVTLSDLTEHRARVAAAKAASTNRPASKPLQQPSKPANKATDSNPATTNDKAKASLIAAVKKQRKNK